MKKDQKWGVINIDNFKEKQPFIFDDVFVAPKMITNDYVNESKQHSNRNCLGIYQIKNLYGVVDIDGNLLTSAKYISIKINTSNDSYWGWTDIVAYAIDTQGKRVEINRNGKEIIDGL